MNTLGGIALAARLKQLSVPAIVIEKNERAGGGSQYCHHCQISDLLMALVSLCIQDTIIIHCVDRTIDAELAAGDSWRKRYRSLCLHDPVW